MTVHAELAVAAARVRELSELIPEAHRPPVAERWTELLDELDRTRSDGGKLLAIIGWRQDFEAELSAKLAHAPLREASR
jgi:hypothetical protein